MKHFPDIPIESTNAAGYITSCAAGGIMGSFVPAFGSLLGCTVGAAGFFLLQAPFQADLAYKGDKSDLTKRLD